MKILLITALILATAGNAFASVDGQLQIMNQNNSFWNSYNASRGHEGLIHKWAREKDEKTIVSARCYKEDGSYLSVEIPLKLVKASPNCIVLK